MTRKLIINPKTLDDISNLIEECKKWNKREIGSLPKPDNIVEQNFQKIILRSSTEHLMNCQHLVNMLGLIPSQALLDDLIVQFRCQARFIDSLMGLKSGQVFEASHGFNTATHSIQTQLTEYAQRNEKKEIA